MNATQSNLVSRTATASTTPYADGFQAYIEGQPLEDMPTEEHAVGWWSANNTGADAETAAWLEAQLEEQVEGRLDDEWNRWGQW